ncbi:MAG TPA: hypothetical protein VMH34_07265 [Gammaproteobacteria bacterium]|nr:hypothetical protein [Gammaproteobacteria bacterium]
MPTTCPKCGHVRSTADNVPDWQCPKCGIAYAKYQARLEDAPVNPPVTVEQKTTRRLTLNDVILICVGILLVMLVIQGMRKSIFITNVLLLVPFFMCMVPAISSTFGDGLYYWNRNRATFDLYDSDAHPMLFRLQQVFYYICAVIFAIFFFKF